MNNASINKLTIRATHILSAFVDVDTISSSEFLTLIKKSEGMGTALMHHLSPLNTKDSIVLKLNDVVVEAFNQASIFEHSYVGTEHLLLAVLKLTSSKDHSRAKSSLVKLSLFPSLGSKTSVPGIGAIMSMFGKILSTGIFVDSLPYYQKPISDSYIALLQKEHSNLALLGGTSASNDLFANYLASSINRFECPLLLSGYTVVSFDLFSFFALATSRSMSIGVMLDGLLSELKALNRVILYIKDFNNLVVSTPTGYTVPIYFTLFMRAIKDTNIKVLIPAEQDIFDRLMSDSPESLDAFTAIKLSQPKETDIYSILKLLRRDYSEYHNVKIPVSVLKYLSKKVLEKDDFTDVMASSLDLLDTACSMVGSTSNVFSDKYKDLIKHSHGVLRDIVKSLDTGDFEHAQVGKAKLARSDKALTKVEDEMFEKEAMTLQNLDIDKALTQLGIKDSSNNIRSINPNKLSSLSRRLKSNVIGQNAAVDAVSKAIIRSTLGLKKGSRPVGSFLFLGPTGVGKTELAKVLAKELEPKFNLIRLDMSDFSEKHNVARLVGAPPGYVGFGEGGELTRKIEEHPNSVVLFDEIEKAHPDVLNILLQILEEGELKDGQGNISNFKDSLVILTSNLGTSILHNKNIGFKEGSPSDDTISTRLQDNLKKILKPELINRLDNVIVFKQLSTKSQEQILGKMLNELRNKLRDQEVILTYDSTFVSSCAHLAYSKEYGAREIRRFLDTKILDQIANVLLNKEERPIRIQLLNTNNKVKIKVIKDAQAI